MPQELKRISDQNNRNDTKRRLYNPQHDELLAKKRWADAKHYLKLKQCNVALDKINEALRFCPENCDDLSSSIYGTKTVILIELGKNVEAFDSVDKSIEKLIRVNKDVPKSDSYYKSLAWLYSMKCEILMSLKRYEEALSVSSESIVCSESIVYNPKNLKSLTYRYQTNAKIQKELKSYDEALKSINQAIEKCPSGDSMTIFYMYELKSEILLGLNQKESALNVIDEVINNFKNTNETLAILYNKKANICIMLCRYQDALYNIDVALKYADSKGYKFLTFVHASKATVLEKLGRNEDAIESINTSISYCKEEKGETIANRYKQKAEILSGAGRYKLAEIEYENAINAYTITDGFAFELMVGREKCYMKAKDEELDLNVNPVTGDSWVEDYMSQKNPTNINGFAI